MNKSAAICYINSTLQSLYYIPEFRNLIMVQSIEIKETKSEKILYPYLGNNISNAFQIIKELGLFYRNRHDKDDICKYILSFNWEFWTKHSDVHEFL